MRLSFFAPALVPTPVFHTAAAAAPSLFPVISGFPHKPTCTHNHRQAGLHSFWDSIFVRSRQHPTTSAWAQHKLQPKNCVCIQRKRDNSVSADSPVVVKIEPSNWMSQTISMLVVKLWSCWLSFFVARLLVFGFLFYSVLSALEQQYNISRRSNSNSFVRTEAGGFSPFSTNMRWLEKYCFFVDFA